MNEKTRKKIVFAVLIIAVIWGYFNYERPEKPVVNPTPSKITRAAADSPQKTTLAGDLIEEKNTAAWGSDPFRIKNGKQVTRQGGNWVVTGILYHEITPLAYINRTPVCVGDTIDNARVKKIEKNYVTLQYNGQEVKIYFAEG